MAGGTIDMGFQSVHLCTWQKVVGAFKAIDK